MACNSHKNASSCGGHSAKNYGCTSYIADSACSSNIYRAACTSNVYAYNTAASITASSTIVKASHINELIAAINREGNRRKNLVANSGPSAAKPSTPANAQVSSNVSVSSGKIIGSNITTVINGLRDTVKKMKTSIAYSNNSTTFIKAATVNEIKTKLKELETACLCNCNYCTCNCNYCTCNCNYGCTCHCNYSCTCNCNYCTCQCNYCTCNCNYCTCNCNYCPCNCNYCTCRCNYNCTCVCYYCTCACNYCPCNCNNKGSC